MWEFLQQVKEVWDDSVKSTNEWIDPLAPQPEIEGFNKLKGDLSAALTKSIDSKWIKDELVTKIVESANNDISLLVQGLWDKTIASFDDFKTQFIQKLWDDKVSAYIDNIVSNDSKDAEQEKLAFAKEGGQKLWGLFAVSDTLKWKI